MACMREESPTRLTLYLEGSLLVSVILYRHRQRFVLHSTYTFVNIALPTTYYPLGAIKSKPLLVIFQPIFTSI